MWYKNLTMKTTKTLIIKNKEILENYVSQAENCTIVEARLILHKADIYYDTESSGSVDTGDYKEVLYQIEITYEQ